jgi:hypothetical protein
VRKESDFNRVKGYLTYSIKVLLDALHSGQVFCDYFEDTSKLSVSPLIKLSLVYKAKLKKNQGKQSKSERAAVRERSRSRIYAGATNANVNMLMKDLICMNQDECSVGFADYIASLNKKRVSRYLFGFFDLSQTFLEFQPSLEIIEERLKDLSLEPFPACFQIHQIYHREIGRLRTFKEPDLTAELKHFQQEIDNFLTVSFAPLHALIAILMQFDFLRKSKNFDKDLKEDFEAAVLLSHGLSDCRIEYRNCKDRQRTAGS